MKSGIVNKTNVFIALLVITGAQIGLSYVNLTPTGNITAALLLAAVETILVGLFFMGLKDQNRLIKATALFPLTLMGILIGAIIMDILIFMKH